MEKAGGCLAAHLQNPTLSGKPMLPGGPCQRNLLHTLLTDSSLEPCQVHLRPSKEDFTIGSYTVVFFPLMICVLMFWFLKLLIFLASRWAKISCKIQTRLITRLIKCRTFRPSCKIKSMPVAAFHNLFTSWLCDAIKMLHLQVILLAFCIYAMAERISTEKHLHITCVINKETSGWSFGLKLLFSLQFMYWILEEEHIPLYS